MLTLALLIAAVLIAALIVSALLPLKFFVFLSGGLATLQLYTVPVAGVYFSASHLGGLGVWRALAERNVTRKPWFLIVATLLIWQGVSMLWSPNPNLAFRQIIYWLPFLFMVPAVMTLARKDRFLIERVITFFLISTLIQVALVAIFRVSPSVEGRFLPSRIASFFVSPNTLAELTNGAYTVFDPAKAGGLFVNANVAAVYMGMSAFLAWGFGFSTKRLWPYGIAAANLCAILLTGSKAGILLMAILPLMGYGVFVIRAGQISMGFAATASFVIAAGIPILYFGAGSFLESSFVGDSSETLSSRYDIWRFAWQVFLDHPFTGLGFGGWEKEWPSYALVHGLNPLFPPHNAFVALFVQSGVFSVLLAAAFCVSLLAELWRVAKRRDGVGALALAIFFSALWAFIQSMGENYGILGEAHITPVLALWIGYVLYLNEKLDVN